MKSMGMAAACITILILFISGCASLQTAGEADAPVDGTIVCEVFYRPSVGTGFESAAPIHFSEGNDQKVHTFKTMTFEAQFQDDEYEGRALSIAVTNLENGAEITRQLYQFDSQNPVENQFIGGHGFTGLVDVF